MAGGGLNAASAAPVEAAPSMSAADIEAAALPATDMKFCSIDNPDCEACQ